ncbi:hypothetical protein CF319_g8027 [Tilletia indica]|nr:hypothetical protein CF319_g8027 [Tilletia indica]
MNTRLLASSAPWLTSANQPTPTLLPSSSTPHSSSKPSSSTEHALIIELGHQDFKPTSGKMPFLFAVDIKHGHITHQAHLATRLFQPDSTS